MAAVFFGKLKTILRYESTSKKRKAHGRVCDVAKKLCLQYSDSKSIKAISSKHDKINFKTIFILIHQYLLNIPWRINENLEFRVFKRSQHYLNIFLELIPLKHDKHANIKSLSRFCGEDAKSYFLILPQENTEEKNNDFL